MLSFLIPSKLGVTHKTSNVWTIQLMYLKIYMIYRSYYIQPSSKYIYTVCQKLEENYELLEIKTCTGKGGLVLATLFRTSTLTVRRFDDCNIDAGKLRNLATSGLEVR